MNSAALRLVQPEPEPNNASGGFVTMPWGAGVPEEIPISDLPSRGQDGRAAARWKQRRWHDLRSENPEQARRQFSGGQAVLCVARAAVWFADTGETAGALWLAAQPAPETMPLPIAEPPGWREADERDRKRHVTAAAARKAWRRLRMQCRNDREALLKWQSKWGERLDAHSIGKTMSTARRLAKWNPEKSMWRDGRRTRGGDPADGISERFQGEFLLVALKVFGGAPGTLKAAHKVAAGWALERGEEAPTYRKACAFYNAKVPASHRGIWHDERKWQRETVESVRRDYGDIQPMQVWSGDWHVCDFQIWHRGRWVRPWLAVWLDLGSRLIVGWTLALRPDTDGILGSFAEAVTEYGAPRLVIIDNGKDYRSKAFSGGRPRKRAWTLGEADEAHVASMCELLDVRVSFCWPFNPGSKPPESWFRTFALNVSRLMPTYTGNKPGARRPAIAAAVKAGQVEAFDLGAARTVVGRYMREVYHNTPHTGDAMNGRTPREAFADNPLPKATAPRHVLERMLLKPVRVRVTRRGVRYNGVHYHAYDLNRRSPLLDLIGQDVLLRVPYREDADASTLEVCDLDGRHICTARNARLDGTSPEDVKELKRRQRAARRQAREGVAELMRRANRPLDVQALQDGQARYAAEHARKAAGAEGVERARRT